MPTPISTLRAIALPLVAALAAAAPALRDAAAAEPIAVLLNADDDDRNGRRDCDDAWAPDGDDEVLVVDAGGARSARVELPPGAPEGSARARLVGGYAHIEALRPRTPGWDGTFRVVLDGAQRVPEVVCRVAPLVVEPGTAEARTVFVREFPGRNDALVAQLGAFCKDAGASLHVVPAGEPYAYNHIWLQDATEFLTSSAGGRSVVLALAANRNRAIDHFARDRVIGPGVGWVDVGSYRSEFARGEGGASWIDWYGNLEASPPTPGHPRGRLLYGFDRSRGAQMNPEVVAFFEAQATQQPLGLDVGWLTIKHVDEMVAFLPARDGGVWILVPDPTAALATLRGVCAAGHGDTPMLEPFEEGATAAAILDDHALVEANERLWRDRIEPMTRALLAGIGLGGDRLKRLPVLFQPGGLPRTPNVVNCLVANGHVAMSDPAGPVVDGADALQAEVRRLLKDAAVEVHFVDDRQYHKWSGNVHCATNAIREPAVGE